MYEEIADFDDDDCEPCPFCRIGKLERLEISGWCCDECGQEMSDTEFERADW